MKSARKSRHRKSTHSGEHNMTLVEVVAQIICIDPSQLNARSRPNNTEGWDSLRHIEVMLAIETAFNVRLSMAELTGLKDLGDVAEALRKKGIEVGDVPEMAQAA